MDNNILDLNYLKSQDWFNKLNLIQKELISQSFYLMHEFAYDQKEFFDYSFIVMPAAKAYEGFIKEKLFNLGFITEKRYLGTRFRVGKALNPEMSVQDPDGFERLYDDIAKSYGQDCAQELWDTWKKCRNRLFHYFINKQQAISLWDAKDRLKLILQAIEKFQNLTLKQKKYMNIKTLHT